MGVTGLPLRCSQGFMEILGESPLFFCFFQPFGGYPRALAQSPLPSSKPAVDGQVFLLCHHPEIHSSKSFFTFKTPLLLLWVQLDDLGESLV